MSSPNFNLNFSISPLVLVMEKEMIDEENEDLQYLIDLYDQDIENRDF